MIVKRGEVWLADLNPTRGSEQAGTRPVLIFQSHQRIYDDDSCHPIDYKFTPCHFTFLRANLKK